MSKNFDQNIERDEQIARGQRIKHIREDELRLNKTDLAKLIGVSSQFLGLVEKGQGNLVYRSIKLLRDLSGHSADYILFGLDDNSIAKTKQLLIKYNDKDIIEALKLIRDLSLIIKNY